MATIIEVTDLSMPELEPFTRLTEAQLRNRLEPEKGSSLRRAPRSFCGRWMPGTSRSRC